MSVATDVAEEPGVPPRPAPSLARLARRVRHVSPPARVLALMIAGYIAVFGTLTWRQQSNFGTFGFDMGIYDQAIWLLSRFEEPFVTVRGLNYFGHHVNPITIVFVPFYWLGAGPHFLYLAETVWMAAGAVPVWLLARDRLANPWLALGLALAYLLHPSLQWINWWHFHPDALIIAPLLFAYWLAQRRRWGWFYVAVGVTLLCKEDAALAVLMLGLVVAWQGERRMGLRTAAVGAAWFIVCTKAIIPAANGGVGPFYEDFFPGFGSSVGEIVWNMLTHPSRVVELATEGERLDYYRMMLAPVALLAVVYPPALAIAAPQTMVNVLSGHAYTYDIRYHYSSILVAAVILATVEACGRIGRRPGLARFLVGAVCAAALAGNVAWSPSPISVKYRSGVWAGESLRHLSVREGLDLVPAGAGVSATYYLVPHLTHRKRIYEYPNPWVPANWGIRDERPHDPAGVEWLVVDSGLLGNHEELYRRLVGPGGDFRVVFDQDGVVVAERVRGRAGRSP